MSDERSTTSKPRLRDLGIVTGAMSPGPLNAITDVPGVRVGHSTIIQGDGPLRTGYGPVRTGVTAILPHEAHITDYPVPAAIRILNGAGEITGRSEIDESGALETPIAITNTYSVGMAYRGVIEWLTQRDPSLGTGRFVIPTVAETLDSFLNDTAGQHVAVEHVFAALDAASSGPVTEGNVGGGTGMSLFGFKGGIGTASRVVPIRDESYVVGVLVQGNFGRRSDLLVNGVPVGREITDLTAYAPERDAPSKEQDGSIIVVIGTNAPLDARQLGRLCRRGMLGLGRVGSTGRNFSGDLLIAFSNAPSARLDATNRDNNLVSTSRLADWSIDDLFEGTIEATEEAVLNALVAAETMTGRDGNTMYALPHDRLIDVMRRYGRLGS